MKKGFTRSAFLLSVLLLGVACGKKNLGGTDNGSGASGSAANVVVKPYVSCKLVNVSDGSTIMRVTNLTSTGNYSASPTAPAQLALNCDQSVAADGGAVTTTVSIDGGAAVPLSGTLSKSVPQPGVKNFKVTVTDANGVSTTANFNVPVSCNPSAFPAIAFDPNQISITGPGASGPGYVNVQLPSASGGNGAQGYYYAIDINGDSRFDDFNNQYWNTNTSFGNMYTLYNGPRSVSVTVFDVACSMEKTFKKTIDFSTILPPMQTGATAQVEPYFYLQGQVDALAKSDGSADTDLADTVHSFDAMEGPGQIPPKHVLCGYQNGQFHIDGENTYTDGNTSTSESLLKQSMTLTFNDTGAYSATAASTGTPAPISYSNIPLQELNYETAASPDGTYNQYLFQKDSACTTSGQIIFMDGIKPCAGSQTGLKYPMVQIVGTFTCPHLSADPVAPETAKRAVSVTKGYYFCQIAPVDQCFGGGGGGGGGIAPPTY